MRLLHIKCSLISFSFLEAVAAQECSEETTMLQGGLRIAAKPVHSHAGLESLGLGPDGDGLCGWSSIFGSHVPETILEVQELIKNACNTVYAETLCTSTAEEMLSTFGQDTTFSSQMESNNHFCQALSELIQASSDHLSDDQSPQGSTVALLNRRATARQGEAIVEHNMALVGKRAPAPGPPSCEDECYSQCYLGRTTTHPGGQNCGELDANMRNRDRDTVIERCCLSNGTGPDRCFNLSNRACLLHKCGIGDGTYADQEKADRFGWESPGYPLSSR